MGGSVSAELYVQHCPPCIELPPSPLSPAAFGWTCCSTLQLRGGQLCPAIWRPRQTPSAHTVPAQACPLLRIALESSPCGLTTPSELMSAQAGASTDLRAEFGCKSISVTLESLSWCSWARVHPFMAPIRHPSVTGGRGGGVFVGQSYCLGALSQCSVWQVCGWPMNRIKFVRWEFAACGFSHYLHPHWPMRKQVTVPLPVCPLPEYSCDAVLGASFLWGKRWLSSVGPYLTILVGVVFIWDSLRC